jgi:DNA-binding PadR family transcriptional regulator
MSRIDLSPRLARSSTLVGQDLVDPVFFLLIRPEPSWIDGRMTAGGFAVPTGLVCNLLLGILRDGKPRHGYALAKDYERRTALTLGAGTVYRELKGLAEAGLVRPVDNPAGADPRRLPHQITRRGAEAFESWFSHVPEVSVGNDSELAARVTFLPEIDSELAARVTERFRINYWMVAKSLERDLEECLRGQTSDAAPAPHPILIHRRLRLVQAELDFLDEVRRKYALTTVAQESEPVRSSDAKRA